MTSTLSKLAHKKEEEGAGASQVGTLRACAPHAEAQHSAATWQFVSLWSWGSRASCSYASLKYQMQMPPALISR